MLITAFAEIIVREGKIGVMRHFSNLTCVLLELTAFMIFKYLRTVFFYRYASEFDFENPERQEQYSESVKSAIEQKQHEQLNETKNRKDRKK